MDVLWQRLDLWLRAALPSMLTFFMTLLEIGAWPLPYSGAVRPALGFIALFYWSAHRPDLFSPAVAFAAGLLSDLINGAPTGLSALLFTAAHQIIWRQRGFFAGHSFLRLWFGFILAVVPMILVQWVFMGLLNWQVAPLLPVLVQMVLTIVLFPLPCWVFIHTQRAALSSN
jgi:rod shape-determining protein MreD